MGAKVGGFLNAMKKSLSFILGAMEKSQNLCTQ